MSVVARALDRGRDGDGGGDGARRTGQGLGRGREGAPPAHRDRWLHNIVNSSIEFPNLDLIQPLKTCSCLI